MSYGETGFLELEFMKPTNGRTSTSFRRQKFPLFMTAPLYIDPNQPDMAFVYVQNPTGAAFAGDRLELKVSAGPNSKVHITTTAATKIYKMEKGFAVQKIDLKVKKGAYLEYIPEMTIPFADSSYEQHLLIDVEDGGRAVLSEMIAPGRLARGEEFAFNKLIIRTQVKINGKEIFCDTINFEPAKRSISVAGVMGDNKYIANLITITPGIESTELAVKINSLLRSNPNVLGSASCLYNGNGVVVRMIGESSIDVSGALLDVWSLARYEIIGTKPPKRRKA